MPNDRRAKYAKASAHLRSARRELYGAWVVLSVEGLSYVPALTRLIASVEALQAKCARKAREE